MLRDSVRATFQAESDPALHAAAASVLSQVHREMHLVFKPDDHAQNETVRLYRAKHPAAAEASQAVTIYPTSRKGAPGLAQR